MTTAFFGSSEYCLPILTTLVSHTDLKLIITRPDKPVGRKKTLSPSPVKTWADTHKILTITPGILKLGTPDRHELEAKLTTANFDLAIVADYGLIISEKIFKAPKCGTVNIHFSKLPDLRGPSPVQFTLLRGDSEAWITIFALEKTLDTGPVISQSFYPVLSGDTTQSLYTRLFQEIAPKLPEILKSFISSPTLTPQDPAKITLCRFLAKEDGFISWDLLQKAIDGTNIGFDELPKIQQEAIKTSKQIPPVDSQTIYNFFRAVTPWPGVWTTHPTGKRMKILNCRLTKGHLEIITVQFESKNPQSWLS